MDGFEGGDKAVLLLKRVERLKTDHGNPRATTRWQYGGARRLREGSPPRGAGRDYEQYGIGVEVDYGAGRPARIDGAVGAGLRLRLSPGHPSRYGRRSGSPLPPLREQAVAAAAGTHAERANYGDSVWRRSTSTLETATSAWSCSRVTGMIRSRRRTWPRCALMRASGLQLPGWTVVDHDGACVNGCRIVGRV